MLIIPSQSDELEEPIQPPGNDEPSDFAVFDIETAPLDDVALAALCPPYEPPEKPGEFDPAAVKCGNLKDAAKIKEKIDAARAAHELAVRDHDITVAKGAAEHFAKFRDKAALDATTGRVVAIGISPCLITGVGANIIDCDGHKEASGLRLFWSWAALNLEVQRPMLGFNIHNFDLPFLRQRSWILGVTVPHGVMNGRYPNPLFIDVMKEWTCHQSGKFVKLNTVALACGLSGKASGSFTLPSGEIVDVDGANFYRVWRRPECRDLATQYLMQDIALPGLIAQRMGVV